MQKYQKLYIKEECSSPCSSASTSFDIMALIIGVGIPPRHATKGTKE